MTKNCNNCNSEKPIDQFGRRAWSKDGYHNYCKACTKANYMEWYYGEPGRKYLEKTTDKRNEQRRLRSDRKKEWNKKYFKEYSSKFPYKRSALYKFNEAVRSGKITRQPCHVCGKPNAQGHHNNYSKPLEVEWLCNQHHQQKHAELKRMGIVIT